MSKAKKEAEQQQIGITVKGVSQTGVEYLPWHDPICKIKGRFCFGCIERTERVKANAKAAAVLGIILGGEAPTEPIKHCHNCGIPCYPGRTGTGNRIGVWAWNASVDYAKWFLETHGPDEFVAPPPCARCRAANAA